MRAHRPAVSWFKHCQPAIAAAMLGALVTVAATYAVGRWENGVTRAQFVSATGNQAVFLQNGINEYLQRLIALRTFFESVDEPITRSEFEFFSSRLFADYPGIIRANWTPRVRRNSRREFELAARNDGIVDYHFQSYGANGALVPALESDDYYPVFYSTEPKTSKSYGINLASDEVRRAVLERARDNDIISVLPNVGIYGATGGIKRAALVAVPVYVKGTSRDTVADRRRNIAGFIIGRFEFARLVETILSKTTSSFGVHLDIYDPATSAQAPPVYRFFPGRPAELLSDEPLKDLAAQQDWSDTLTMGDVKWTMSSGPLADSPLSARHERAGIVAVAGMIITTILVAYILFSSYHSRELALANRRVHDLAQIDVLTGLANRSHFMGEIERVREVLIARGPFSILMLDLDGFKEVNDTLGHAAGDALLKQISRRLQKGVGGSDVLARLGGDEFAILHFSPDSDEQRGEARQSQRDHTQSLAILLIDALKEPFDLDGSTISISVSIGISVAPDDGFIAEELLKKADLALYESKSTGRAGYCFFDPQMTVRASERHGLKSDLRIGLERGEFELDYQPFVNVASRRTVGVEALVRWRHPVHGLMPPDRFIPIAEESGLIVPLGKWVLDQACEDAIAFPDHIKVAVNLSVAQFRGCNMFDVVTAALARSGLPAWRLEVEVTETVLLEKRLDYLAVLRQLKDSGVSVALDDFGTGYSSLSYLKQFPFDKIKIDRLFIKDITERADCAAIVNSITGLGRNLDIVTTAEGVETEEQFDIVRAAGVTLAQGYLFGKPQRKETLMFGEAPIALREHQSDHPGQAA